jgi:L-iditol 2-dehydrogenase
VLVAELTAPHEFRLAQETIEDPAPHEVQVRVDAVGICGSDLHAYSEGAVGDTPSEFPMVLGHEPAGTIVKVGSGITGWSPGDRAALEPAIYCYHCEFCRSGRHNICANLKFLSNPGFPGFFREFVNLPVESLFAIPPRLSMDVATLAEPLAVALHSMQFASIRVGESVLVFGAGAIGLLTIASAKLAGAGRIFAIDPLPHRRALARHMGADDVFDPADGGAVRDVHCAIDCAAKEDTTNAAIRATRHGGRVVVTGIHSGVTVPFEVSPMRRKELSIFSVRRSNDEMPAAVNLLLDKTAWFAPIVTHSRPLDQIGEGFDIAERYLDGVGKIVMTQPTSR